MHLALFFARCVYIATAVFNILALPSESFTNLKLQSLKIIFICCYLKADLHREFSLKIYKKIIISLIITRQYVIPCLYILIPPVFKASR